MSNLFTARKRTDWLVVHCSATSPKQDIGAKEIRQWHRQKGWIDIGYHFVIRRNGTVEKGRPIDVVGAHVENWNAVSVGVCMAGGIDEKGQPENNFTPAQFAALAELLIDLKKQYPDAQVKGHRDFPNVKKACPSFDVRQWIEETGVFKSKPVVMPAIDDDTGEIIRCVEVTNAAPNFFRLAKRYGYTVEALMKANPLVDPASLKVGQLIRLPD